VDHVIRVLFDAIEQDLFQVQIRLVHRLDRLLNLILNLNIEEYDRYIQYNSLELFLIWNHLENNNFVQVNEYLFAKETNKFK